MEKLNDAFETYFERVKPAEVKVERKAHRASAHVKAVQRARERRLQKDKTFRHNLKRFAHAAAL